MFIRFGVFIRATSSETETARRAGSKFTFYPLLISVGREGDANAQLHFMREVT